MTTKQKIALHGLVQKVTRGIFTEEQAKKKFEEITGFSPDDVPSEDDQDAQELGKFLDSLNASVQTATLAKEEAEKEETESTVDLNPLTDKIAKKRPQGRKKTEAKTTAE